MNAAAITCPYCNSLTPVPSSAVVGQRLPCPRCGEAFPYKPDEGQAAATASLNGTPLLPVSPPVSSAPRLSNRVIAGLVLAMMLLAAGGALVLALWTTNDRRNNDPKDPEAIAFLPKDANVVAGLHVARILEAPGGREFLTNFRLSDVVPLPQQAPANLGTANLEQWTGLKLEDIDQLVIGANVDKPEVPRVILVVRTTGPYDAEKVRAALDAHRSADPDPRRLYEFQMKNSPIPGVLWFASNRLLVVGLLTENLDAVPAEPHKGLGHLPDPLRDLLEQNVGPKAQAWFLGHSNDWTKTSARLLIPYAPKEMRPMLEKVRTFGVWLTFDDDLALSGAVNAADVETAKAWEGNLAPREGERKPIRLFGQRKGMEPIGQELAETLKATRKDTLVTVHARAKGDTVRQALKPTVGP